MQGLASELQNPAQSFFWHQKPLLNFPQDLEVASPVVQQSLREGEAQKLRHANSPTGHKRWHKNRGNKQINTAHLALDWIFKQLQQINYIKLIGRKIN